MLSVVKYCTRIVTKGNITSVPTWRTFSSCSPKRSIFYNNFVLLKQSLPFQLKLPRQGVLRQISDTSVKCAPKVDKKSQKIVGSWLFVCGSMVFVAVVLGGVTRLTESGLSMVTWKLLGEKMPSSEIEWLAEFERYKQFPEFKITNKDISLEDFKRIWLMEYLHRMWGRLIGGVFIVPATYFWARGMLKPGMKLRVTILGSLIGLQGLMGWYMVKSGLDDRFTEPSDVPRVSQYRLASHLALAFVIYTGFLYQALDHLLPAHELGAINNVQISNKIIKQLRKFRILVHSTKGLVFLTALSGAFVAGLDAGLIYNSFPKMANKWIPDDILALTPVIKNITENPTTVQFDHRLLGISTLALITYVTILSRNYKLPGRSTKAVLAVVCAGYLQVLLGITTLLHHVPLEVATLHQSGSLILLSTVVWLCHELKHLKKLPK